MLHTPEMQLGQVAAELAEACNTVKIAFGLCLNEQYVDIVVLSRNLEKHIMSMPSGRSVLQGRAVYTGCAASITAGFGQSSWTGVLSAVARRP